MSGGSYNYLSFQMDEAASTLRSRHPDEPHILALAAELERLGKVMHDVEWADSFDTSWTPELHAAIRAAIDPRIELRIAAEGAERHLSQLYAAIVAAREVAANA